ncbi:MAG: calcium/sodium antiporter [Bacteroidaceae bacterium]|nr:calcium/sodium antiporter [Bacteroidaceae bacterium]
MLTDVLLLLLGLVLVTLGSDWLVEGASGIARRAGVAEFVIGMTVVGFGTSMPELVSSLFSALEGHGDMAIGNVTGSNICNVLLILGVTGMITPLFYSKENIRRDIPICIAVTMLLSLMVLRWNPLGIPVGVSRWDGIILLACFVLFMVYSFQTGKRDATSASTDVSDKKGTSMAKAVLLALAGIAGLVVGGKLFVDNTVNVAHALHVSDAFIAVTMMAFGTSVPELATCVVAALKKKNDLALGNIIGSCIFNILLIIGVSATVTPLSISSLTRVDLALFLLSSLLLLSAVFCFRKRAIDRADAVIYLLCYAAYVVWLFSIQ